MLEIHPIAGLGNQIYQYVFCRMLAEKLKYNFYITEGKNYYFGPTEQYLPKYFNIDMGIKDGDTSHIYKENNDGSAVLDDVLIGQPWSHDLNEVNRVLNKIPDYTLFNGFFANYNFFEYDLEKVKSWFIFREEYNNTINKYDVNEYVYIHFRGGDVPDYNVIYDANYYKEAVKLFDIKKYLIITDNIKNAEQCFDWMTDKNIISNSTIDDFYSMTRAKYFIGSLSTLSDWAGYLNIHNHQMIFTGDGWNSRIDMILDNKRFKSNYLKYLDKA